MPGQRDIYDGLYDIVEGNISREGKKLYASRKVFSYMCETRLGYCDMERLKDADGIDYLQMAFLGLLRRFPEDKVIEAWSDRMKEGDYKEKLLESLINCEEARMKNSHLINMVQSNTVSVRSLSARQYAGMAVSGTLKGKLYGLGSRLRQNDTLLRLYMRLPTDKKEMLKRMFAR